MIDVRDNWRILLLVVLCVLSAVALFAPFLDDGGSFGEGNEEFVSDPTNLQYGLELSGGARVRGQLDGLLVEDLSIGPNDQRDVLRTVASELGIEQFDVQVRLQDQQSGSVEVFADNVTRDQMAAALQAAGFDVSASDVTRGVTEQTIENAVDTLSSRIDETGFQGGQVTTVSSLGGETFIVAEAPGVNRTELQELIGEPGRVQLKIGYPGENGTYVTNPLLDAQDLQDIQNASPPTQNIPNDHVPVRLTDEAGERFQNELNTHGFTDPNRAGCTWPQNMESGGPCLLTVVDGEIIHGSGIAPNLAETIRTQQFAANPSFVMQTGTFEEAQNLEINLRSGSLPTELTIETSSFISPSHAQSFKALAVLTALGAWIGVSLVVYFWYRDIRVAIPMLLTAAAEVFLLLGFAATIGLAIDLSHIAGFIAVIGTGLDDLIIMADEILQRRQRVETGKIFQNRFRKAFWVIGMAAATTIIAMSPLAVLSLGELQGFAIVTIAGVLIGVGITRPAYGDILRHLMLDDVKRK
jgi:preprotein translocase subunit SecD